MRTSRPHHEGAGDAELHQDREREVAGLVLVNLESTGLSMSSAIKVSPPQFGILNLDS